MASNPWKSMFPPHIWQRGVDYYRDGRVLDLHYRSSEVTAQVEGGETYTVSVTFNKARDGITDYFCDCPYERMEHLASTLPLYCVPCRTSPKILFRKKRTGTW